MITQAILLAGGKGTRLRPYTTVLPKPLMPIGDYPILEILIRKLEKNGVKDIIIATGYLSHIIKAYFGNGEKFGVNIRYSHETKRMGTAGPLKLVDDLDENFLVMNGDLLTDLSFAELIKYHTENNNEVSVSIYKKEVKIDLGVLTMAEDGSISDYIEKPTYDFNVSMGIYAMNRRVIDRIPEDTYYDLPDLVLKLITEKAKLGGYLFTGIWLDVGRPKDYELALDLFENNKSEKFMK